MADTKTTQKYRINRVVDANGNLVVVHPETEAEQVLYTGTIGTTDVANVDQALGALKTLAENSGVTGVKGSAESTYRKGNVNLTPANIGLGNVDNTSDMDKPVSTAQQTAINDAVSSANSYTDGALESYIPTSQKGANNGVATLGADGKVPTSQLPSYVDDVVEYANLSGFPTTGVAGKIYVDKQTNKTYRWSGTGYTEISASLALGETSSTAYAGDKGKKNADDIASIQTRMQDIEDGEVSVGHAEDADTLGGILADQYVTFDKMPEEFVIVTGSYGSSTLTLEANAYTTIQNAVNADKFVVLDVTGIGRCYYNSGASGTSYGSYYFRNVDGDKAYTITVKESEATIASKDLVNDVLSTGTGAFVSKVEQFGNAVSVTRKAITNDDLPTQEGLATGLYSAVVVNTRGVVTAGGKSIEWGTSVDQTEPSDSLMENGLFFQLVE